MLRSGGFGPALLMRSIIIRRPSIGRLSLVWSCVVVLAIGTGAALASGIRDERPRVAREIRDQIVRGEAASLWSRLDEGMRKVVRDSVSFAIMSAGISAQLGSLDSLLGEEVSDRDTLFILRTRARFSKMPTPVVITVGLRPSALIGTLSVRPDAGAAREAPSAFLEYVPKARFRLPFSGEWLCFWGGRTVAENYHAATRAQRFAYDLVMVRDGKSHAGAGDSLSDYYCYGQPILAPAAGLVVTAVDSLPDQAIGSRDPLHAAGNHVVIDHGNREFSLVAHLQPGSVRVRAGKRVNTGDVLGLAGNSGNTSEPHLHVHLMNAPSMQDADGLPMPFEEYEADGVPVPKGEPRRFQKVRRKGS